MLVYSHLRWDSVYQRPQQLMSRLARNRRILFIEEPVFHAGAPHWQVTEPVARLRVCRPHTPVEVGGFSTAQLPTLLQLGRGLLAAESIGPHAAWLYTPLAVPLARSLKPEVVAYDCMDELSGFLNAPPELAEREAELFRWADLAFMGGPSLYRAKRHLNPRVYCFPSSVDASHFHTACQGLPDHTDQRELPRPRLGFYGVIDERLDIALVEALADARPEWQIVLVGPVVKIRPESLPRRPNLHYMGGRPYAELPAFLAGWDVCLLPFARNAATRFISPTKTLEYMAAERPIVSTSITDVVESYSDIVMIADTIAPFVAACELALVSDTARTVRIARMREVLARTSWDATAEAMERKLEGVTRRRQRRDPGYATPRTHATVDLALGVEERPS